MIDSVIDRESNMPREIGSKSFSPRELRLRAENEALKARLKAEQAKNKAAIIAKDARIKELKSKI
jgi:hypothetical protein